MEYNVIVSRKLGDLKLFVDEATEQGWRPQGGVSVIVVNDDQCRYFQAVVKGVNPIDWSSDECDPVSDIEALTRNIREHQKREIKGLCGLHGDQAVRKIVFAGVELECGCRIVNVGNTWRFTTERERGDGIGK